MARSFSSSAVGCHFRHGIGGTFTDLLLSSNDLDIRVTLTSLRADLVMTVIFALHRHRSTAVVRITSASYICRSGVIQTRDEPLGDRRRVSSFREPLQLRNNAVAATAGVSGSISQLNIISSFSHLISSAAVEVASAGIEMGDTHSLCLLNAGSCGGWIGT
jgi:hypothetical protein